MTAFSGGCLCGAVHYEGKENLGGGHCHCEDCRKSSGSGHCSHMIVPAESFTISGEVKFFDKETDMKNVVSRGFCPQCGAPVYSLNSGFEGIVFVRASSLDDPEVFQPRVIVYTKRAPSWDAMNPELPAFEEMPPPEAKP
ncbi:MAG: GFA family protein [Hyphomicrobiales bacterium]